MNQQTDRKYCLYGNVESSSCIIPFCREEGCYMCCLILFYKTESANKRNNERRLIIFGELYAQSALQPTCHLDLCINK